ncbi:MAG: lactate racemase domain-containing protein [Candidatus Micrarchaeota archaeon]
MQAKISCGSIEIPLTFPSTVDVKILTPHPPNLEKDILSSFRKSLSHPIGPSLHSIAVNKRGIFFVQDQTRSVKEKEELAEAIFEELSKGKPSELHVMISTGTHKPNTEKDLKIIEMLKEKSFKYGVECTFEIHDSEQDKDASEYTKHILLGKTPAVTPIYAHRKHMEADFLIGVTSMKMHYFAGYSNMLKLLALPGPSGYETVRRNHELILDPRSLACSHPLHYSNKDNPVANDMYEAYKLIVKHKLVNGKIKELEKQRPVFILASVSDTEKGETGIVWSAAGEAEEVTRQGIKEIDQHYTFSSEPSDIVILGAGPHPYDRHLFYVHNGADTARRGLKKGGKMLVIAECPEGIGPEGEQTKKFVEAVKKPKEEILDYVRGNFQVGMQKSYKLGELLNKASEICFYLSPNGKLDESELHEMHLSTTRDPQAWLDGKLSEKPDSKILIITKEATRVALV